MAVEDIVTAKAIDAARDNFISNANIPINVAITIVPKTCIPPRLMILFFIFQNSFGSSSKPTRNNIITTPNSVACIMSVPSFPTNSNT